MTYAELGEYLMRISEERAGQVMSDQELDEIIELVSQLPCTGEGPSKPLFREPHVAMDLRSFDGRKPTGFGCPHRSFLADYKWMKSVREAGRNSTPLPPIP